MVNKFDIKQISADRNNEKIRLRGAKSPSPEENPASSGFVPLSIACSLASLIPSGYAALAQFSTPGHGIAPSALACGGASAALIASALAHRVREAKESRVALGKMREEARAHNQAWGDPRGR